MEPGLGELVRSIALLRGRGYRPLASGYLVHFTVDRPDTVSLLLLLDQAIGSVVCPEGWLGGSEHGLGCGWLARTPSRLRRGRKSVAAGSL